MVVQIAWLEEGMEFCVNWEKHLSLAKVSLNISYEISFLGIKPQPHSQGLLAYRRFEEEFLTEQVSETKQDNLRKILVQVFVSDLRQHLSKSYVLKSYPLNSSDPRASWRETFIKAYNQPFPYKCLTDLTLQNWWRLTNGSADSNKIISHQGWKFFKWDQMTKGFLLL